MALSQYTTLRLGGPARRLLEAASERAIVELALEQPALVLAGGSNVVIADEGIDGTVLRVVSRGVRCERDGERVLVTAQAGEPWDDLVAACVAEGLAGIECLAGIPGSTGATPIQNVGAYGQDVSETIVAVRALDRETGEIAELTPQQCGFGYRTSAFKYHDRHVILAVTFALRPSQTGQPVRYAELARALGVELGAVAPLAAVREAVLELRRAKGMVIDAADPDSVSAGSFFTNPIVDPAQLPDGAPAWPEPGGRVKTSAAWLIERAGFQRGYGDGRVGLSSKHTLAIVNRGGATTAELLDFARTIAATVQERFGIALHPEPVLVGVKW